MSEILPIDHPLLAEPVSNLSRRELEGEAVRQFAGKLLKMVRQISPERLASVGLAAAQLNKPVNLVAVDMNADRLVSGEDELLPSYMVLANLAVIGIDDEVVKGPEGCSSMGALKVMLKRLRRVRVQGWRLHDGEFVEFDSQVEGKEGYVARAFQHLDDHTKGLTLQPTVATRADPSLYWLHPAIYSTNLPRVQLWPPTIPGSSAYARPPQF
jgi:peptide deformylase